MQLRGAQAITHLPSTKPQTAKLRSGQGQAWEKVRKYTKQVPGGTRGSRLQERAAHNSTTQHEGEAHRRSNTYRAICDCCSAMAWV